MESSSRDSAARQPVHPAGAPHRLSLERAMLVSAGVLLAALAVGQFDIFGQHYMARLLMQREDTPVILATAVLLLLLAYQSPLGAAARMGRALERSVAPAACVMTVAAGLFVFFGTHLIALDFAYSRDEAMAEFDAAIIASGRLIAMVPPEWRQYVPALQPEFRLEVPGHVAWVSSYLPGNAAIRGVFGRALGTAGTNAFLVVLSLAAVFGIARRLFPGRPDAWLIAVALMATSSQVLFMGMTPYAMTAHLALNLVWLWLFLRNDAPSHACAVIVGFIATGLHQILFHPLFIAPFLLQLLLQRRLPLLAFYVVAYAAIGLFWIGYWQWLLARSGVDAVAAGNAGLPFLVSRVVALLADFRLAGLETINQNLLRFAAWQNPLLLALGATGIGCAFSRSQLRADAPMWPLAGGIVLTLAAMFVLLPYQGSGWGYRYIHGLIASLALLSAFAWVRMTGDNGGRSARSVAWSAFLGLTAFSVLVLVPVHAVQVHKTHAPYANAVAAMKRSKFDAIVVDTTSIFYGNDLVRNDPDLADHPRVFDFGMLDAALIEKLCARSKVAVFSGADAARYGIVVTDPSDHPERERLEAQWALMKRLSCSVPFE